ncbi:MAG: hypothetical protein QXU32_09930 [Nitrososphaerales archaeon]
MNKKVIVGIILGTILITSIAGILNINPVTYSEKIKDIERRHELALDVIDNASVSWQRGAISDVQFIAVIDQSIIETDNLQREYLSLNLPSTYDKYKRLSIDSLVKQKEAFLKLKEYVQTEDIEARQLIRAEFDQLITTSFEYRRDALRELDQ